MMLISTLFQAFVPRGYMPGNLVGGDSLLVICGSNIAISFEEAAGLEPGTLSNATANLHADELCAFSGLVQADSASQNQQYIQFYLSHLQENSSYFPVGLYTPRYYLLPVKTGPPAA